MNKILNIISGVLAVAVYLLAIAGMAALLYLGLRIGASI